MSYQLAENMKCVCQMETMLFQFSFSIKWMGVTCYIHIIKHWFIFMLLFNYIILQKGGKTPTKTHAYQVSQKHLN